MRRTLLLLAAFVSGCAVGLPVEPSNVTTSGVTLNSRVYTSSGGDVTYWFRYGSSTAYGTEDKSPRPYRYGYGVLDENLNGVVDPGEKRVYFEIGDYNHYVFFESPR